MGKVKITREDLKKDEIKDFGASVYELYENRRVAIWIALGAFVLIWLTIRLWGGYRERRLVESWSMLDRARIAYMQGMNATDPQERTQLLSQAADQCAAVRGQYPGSPAAAHSLLIRGQSLFYLNNPDAAADEFMEYREIAADNDGKSLAHLLLGYSHENRYFKSGMAAEDIYAKAEDNYRAAADLAETGYLKRQALMGRARMLEIKGRIDDAIAIYEKIVADRKTAREEDIKRFGLDRESAKSKLDLDLPSIEEVFGAAHIAEVQIERLKALKESGALAAASERAVPAGAPLETAEIALASTDTATLETSEPLAPEAEAIAPELEAAPAPEPIEEPIQESAAPETAAEAAAEEPAMEPAPEAAAAPEPALETPATPAEEPAAEPAAETDPEPAMEPAAELAPEAEALVPETEAATAPEPIEEPILESAVPEAAPEAAADAPAPGESAPRTDEAATTQTAQAADPPRDSMPAAP